MDISKLSNVHPEGVLPSFRSFLHDRQRVLGLTVAQLSTETRIRTAILHKYLSGARRIPQERAEQLRATLCPTPVLQRQFDEYYAQSQPTDKARSPLELTIDSPNARLRLVSLNYGPFSGEKTPLSEQPPFMEQLIEKCLHLAVIQLETSYPEKRATGEPIFDINGRIEAVERRRADLLLNLMSLQRMKKLHFIPTPIRIALNGVMFQRQALQPGDDRLTRLNEARALLVSGVQSKTNPFCVITIRNEVGHVFLEQSHRLKEERDEERTDRLSDFCLYPQETLDSAYLARKMETLADKVPVMLVSDEHSALAVLRELKGNGILVLSPSSDQAVIHSVERRIPPAYYYAIGMRRANNGPLIEYLEQIFSAFLAVEGEGIAESLAATYQQLVDYVKECLGKTGIYIGGIRRTTERADRPAPAGVLDPAGWEKIRSTLVEQNARAVARRCLSLSRRSVETLPPELRQWEPILRRARERIQVSDGGDRARIRNIIIFCARMALGRDPFSSTPETIPLLRELVPAFEPRPHNASLSHRRKPSLPRTTGMTSYT